MQRKYLWILVVLAILTSTVSSQSRRGQTRTPASSIPAPIATAEHEVGEVEVALMEVKRTSAGEVTIRYRYTNKAAASKTLHHGSDGLDAWRFASGVHYVAGGKKYEVLKGENDYPVAAQHQQFGTGINLKPKQVVNTWAKFPAPPEDVTEVTVYLPGAPPFEKAPLSK